MAHTIPETVKLSNPYNAPIKQAKTKGKRFRYLEGRSSRERSTMVDIEGNILSKPIQVYRMWYRYLQLALELEQLEVKIITKEKRVPLKKPKKDAWGHTRKYQVKPITHRVQVNKSAYAEWNLDAIPKTSFNDWWENSKHLFFEEPCVLVNSKSDWVDDENYQYIRIDKRKRANDVAIEVRNLLNTKNTKPTSTSRYPVNGMPNIDTLINRYNALVLMLKHDSPLTDIFEMGFFRQTKVGMDKSGYKISAKNEGRIMRDLMLPAKITLLSVCDGYFLKHPKKSYI